MPSQWGNQLEQKETFGRSKKTFCRSSAEVLQEAGQSKSYVHGLYYSTVHPNLSHGSLIVEGG